MTYILELDPEQVEPILVSALKESIINEYTVGESDQELIRSFYQVLRYFTCQDEYNAALNYIADAVEEINKE